MGTTRGVGRGGRSETLGCGKGKGHKSDDACTMPHEGPRRSGLFPFGTAKSGSECPTCGQGAAPAPRVPRETESEALGLR